LFCSGYRIPNVDIGDLYEKAVFCGGSGPVYGGVPIGQGWRSCVAAARALARLKLIRISQIWGIAGARSCHIGSIPAVYDVFASPNKGTAGFQGLQKCGWSVGMERSGMTWPHGTLKRPKHIQPERYAK
jgi:hypothetical protein